MLDFTLWLEGKGLGAEAAAARESGVRSALGLEKELAGAVGERNLCALHPRGRILIAPLTEGGMYRQVAAALATGNEVIVDAAVNLETVLSELPATVASRITVTSNWEADGPFSGALVEGDAERVRSTNQGIAKLSGPLVLVQSATTDELVNDSSAYSPNEPENGPEQQDEELVSVPQLGRAGDSHAPMAPITASTSVTTATFCKA